MYIFIYGKMANPQIGGFSLGNDLAELRAHERNIEDYKKTVLILESQENSNNTNVLIQTYKINILQLETRNKYIRDKIDRL